MYACVPNGVVVLGVGASFLLLACVGVVCLLVMWCGSEHVH